MGADRLLRYSEEVKRVVSSLIQNELKDPRIPSLTSVIAVNVTRDLRYAKIYVSVFGSKEEKDKCLEGLKSAAGFVRKEVGSRIKSHYTPEIIFILDDSIERAIELSKKIDEIRKD